MFDSHPDYRALLRAVLSAPEDDVPRLVLADWLEEHFATERAEFIRIQCELAGLPPCGLVGLAPSDCLESRFVSLDDRCGPCDRRDALRRRERALYDRHGWPGWWPGPATLFHPAARPPLGAFRRGFLHSVTCPAADWLRSGDAIRRQHPVGRVRLTDRPELATWRTAAGASYGWALAGDPDPDWCLPFDAFDARLTADKSGAQVVCEARWDGVSFEMPPLPLIGVDPGAGDDRTAVAVWLVGADGVARPANPRPRV